MSQSCIDFAQAFGRADQAMRLFEISFGPAFGLPVEGVLQ
jgi:hypothetical protein